MSNSTQHKLFHYEAPPPAAAWDAIAAELDGENRSFSKRLAAYEATPSVQVWDKIAASLDTETAPAKVIPFYQKHSKWIRYGSMAAAIFAGVILFNLLSKDAESDTISQLPTTQSVQTPNTQASSAPKSTIAKENSSKPAEKNTDSKNNSNTPLSARVASNRYMTMANDEGKTVRLSKKVYPVIDCAEKTEESTWSKCKENIQALQAKMAASVGAGDFGGLMDMIKSLEEKQ